MSLGSKLQLIDYLSKTQATSAIQATSWRHSIR
jgi:hypothetical protein